MQPEEDVQPTEPTQPADVAGSYQNDPYKSVNQEQNTSYGEPNNYEYGQGYGQQNQNYNQQNQNYTQQAPNYGQHNQGYYQQNNFNGMPQEPVNWVPYLILSIISTLCCCLPFGVVGIVFSAKINSAMLAGNLEEAQNNAKMARIWIIVSFAIGLLTWLIYMVLIVTGAVSGSAYYYWPLRVISFFIIRTSIRCPASFILLPDCIVRGAVPGGQAILFYMEDFIWHSGIIRCM